MYQDALVSGFVNISVYIITKLANNFKPNDRFFERIQILLVIQTENQSATPSFSDPLLMQSAIHCSSSGDDSRKLYESRILINSQLEKTHSSQCSAVQCPTIKNYKYINYSSHARYPPACVDVTGLLRRLQVNFQVFKIIK